LLFSFSVAFFRFFQVAKYSQKKNCGQNLHYHACHQKKTKCLAANKTMAARNVMQFMCRVRESNEVLL